MGHPPGEHLTSQVAREICQRTGSAAVLEGSISSLGSEYVIGLNAVTCQTGDVLARHPGRAERRCTEYAGHWQCQTSAGAGRVAWQRSKIQRPTR